MHTKLADISVLDLQLNLPDLELYQLITFFGSDQRLYSMKLKTPDISKKIFEHSDLKC